MSGIVDSDSAVLTHPAHRPRYNEPAVSLPDVRHLYLDPLLSHLVLKLLHDSFAHRQIEQRLPIGGECAAVDLMTAAAKSSRLAPSIPSPPAGVGGFGGPRKSKLEGWPRRCAVPARDAGVCGCVPGVGEARREGCFLGFQGECEVSAQFSFFFFLLRRFVILWSFLGGS